MTFTDFYRRRFVADLFSSTEFDRICSSYKRYIPIEKGKYYIDKKTVLNCVSYYYNTNTDESIKKKSNPFITCQETCRKFQINNDMDCLACHKACHEKMLKGELKIKENKKRR